MEYKNTRKKAKNVSKIKTNKIKNKNNYHLPIAGKGTQVKPPSNKVLNS